MIIQIAVIALLCCCKETKSETLTACSGYLGPKSVDIDCKSQIIAITSATFEKVTNCFTKTPVTPPCTSSTAIDVAKMACQSKSDCQLKPSEVTFGTMCSGYIKIMFLKVSYTCVSGSKDDCYPRPLRVTKSSVQIEWQKLPQDDSTTQYVVERRYVPASQPSAVAGLSFEGFGYIKFSPTDSFNGGKKFETRLKFRTSSPNGLLFVAFIEKDWSSYSYLQLTNGKLKFAVKGSKGSVNVTATATLNDNQFHTVVAKKSKKNSNTIKLTVDGIEASKDDDNGEYINVNVDSVYIGGLIPNQSVETGVLSHKDGFIGCIYVEQLEGGISFASQKNESYENVRWSTNGCPSAVQNGMHFRGTGYAKLTLSSSSRGRLQLSFRMRTSWPNGLLLAAYSDDKSDFLFIETHVDGLDLRYKKGSNSSDGPFLVRFLPRTVSLCDGAWHTVILTIDKSSFVVTVDGVLHNTSSHITDVQAYWSDIMKNFYLGGIERKGLPPTMAEVALGYGVNVTSFGGCLADFKVNGQLLDYVMARNASLNVSFAGCPDFTWGGPTCKDQVLHVGSKGEGNETLTDTNGIKPFTEYLYRVAVRNASDVLVPGKWIVVRSGEDETSGGPLPELDYDGSTSEGTFRWTGPPAIVKDSTSYDIKYSEVYQGSTVQSSVLTFDDDLQGISLPYTSFVSPSTTYVFAITASFDQGSVTSSYVRITTTGRECRRFLYRGTYYRGTTSVSADDRLCLNWSKLSTYSNLIALYPEAGLGNHSYCRNPIAENRTMPWCYTENRGGCLNWTYCDIDECEDTACYSSLDNGYGYRGSSSKGSCVSWNRFTAFPVVSQYATAGLGDHSYCRNPDPQTRSKPWCYKSDGDKRDCSVKECTNDVSIVNYVCGGDSDGNDKCVFPFVHKGKRFFECTSFDRDAPWCSIKNAGGQAMKEWAYCLCPKPSISMSLPTYSPPVSGRVDGTCLELSTTATPTTVLPSTVATTTFSSALPMTSNTSDASTVSSANSSHSPFTTSNTSSVSPTASNAFHTPSETASSTTTSRLSTSPSSRTSSATNPAASATTSFTTLNTATTDSNFFSEVSATTSALKPASEIAFAATSSAAVPHITSSIIAVPISSTNSRSSAFILAAATTSFPLTTSNTANSSNLAVATEDLKASSTASTANSSILTAPIFSKNSTTVASADSAAATAISLTTSTASAVVSISTNSKPAVVLESASSNTFSNFRITSSISTALISPTNSITVSSEYSAAATTMSLTTSNTVTTTTDATVSATTVSATAVYRTTITPVLPTEGSPTSDVTDSEISSSTLNDSKLPIMYIGIGVGGGVLVITILVVVAVIACRKCRSSKAYAVTEQAMELQLRSSRIHSPSYDVDSPFKLGGVQSDDEYQDSSVFQNLCKPTSEYCQPVQVITEPETSEYCQPVQIITEPKKALICQGSDSQDDYEVPVTLAEAQAKQKVIPESKGDIYWEPATSEEKLYDQFTAAKFRVLERSSVELKGVLGTGQFGTVERGIWKAKNSKCPIMVAVKTLKSESKENKVKFLQEAAIMGQFNHRNVVVMHGVVLTGKPLMVVLEILPKGDLKQYLQSIANEDTLPLDLPSKLLQMARDIAAGMEYLAKRCFVHRDLAARNVLLGEKLVCKIADFGLSRDLADDNYYVTKGGQIPFRWTAPEAVSFRKYSTSSDVWSYGIVLYEIWSVGKRPYGHAKNRAVIDRLESGYRLPPPPGCSYAIYNLMIECWNPDHHKRPTFNAIATRLSQPDEMLLANDAIAEPITGSVGDALEASQSAYEALQKAYKASSAY